MKIENKNQKNRKTQKIVISLCLLRRCLLRVLWCSVCFCTGHFVMVPINLICPHCLQHFFFDYLLHLYSHVFVDRLKSHHDRPSFSICIKEMCKLSMLQTMYNTCLSGFKKKTWQYGLHKYKKTRTTKIPFIRTLESAFIVFLWIEHDMLKNKFQHYI